MADIAQCKNVTSNVKVLTWSVAGTVWLPVRYLLHLFKTFWCSSKKAQNKHLSVITKLRGRFALLNKSTNSFCEESNASYTSGRNASPRRRLTDWLTACQNSLQANFSSLFQVVVSHDLAWSPSCHSPPSCSQLF